MVGSPLSINPSPSSFASPNYSFGQPRNPNQPPYSFGGPLTDSFYSSGGGYNAGLGYNPGLGSGGNFPVALMLMPLILGVIPLLQSLFSGLGRNNEEGDSGQNHNRNSNNTNSSNGCNCAKSMNLDIGDDSYAGGQE